MSAFIMLPITVNDLELPVVPGNLIRRFGLSEDDAYAHWSLGDSSASLVDSVRNKTLTPQNASFPPTYSASHLSMSGANGRALLSDLSEPASSGGYTLCAVQRVPASGSSAPLVTMGTLDSSAGTSIFVGGEAAGARKMYLTVRGVRSSVDAGITLNVGQWFFSALSVSYDALKNYRANIIAAQNGNVSAFAASNNDTATYVPHTGKIALGNANLTTTGSINVDHAEFLLFGRALTPSEMSDVYSRAKLRMQGRGISI